MRERNRLKKIGWKALTVLTLGLLFLALLPGKTLADPAGNAGTASSENAEEKPAEQPGTEPGGKAGTLSGGKTIRIYLHEGSMGTSQATVDEIRAGKPVPGVVFNYWKFTRVPDGFKLDETDEEEMNAQLIDLLDKIREGKLKNELDQSPSKAKKTAPSDARGEITVSGLTPGIYYFEEDQTKKSSPAKPNPQKPKTDDETEERQKAVTHFSPFLVVITETSEEQAIYPKSYTTELPGALLLKKVDDQDKPLAGVSFKLYDSQDEALSVYKITGGSYDAAPRSKAAEPTTELVTDARGQIKVVSLPPGAYYFKEVSPAPGFSIMSEKTDPIMVGAGDTAEMNVITVKNYRTYRFFKYDSKTDKPVKNAVFHLVVKGTLGRWKDYDNSKGTVEVQSGADGPWTKAGNPVVVKSGSDGWFAIRGLPKDIYGLKPGVKEVTAPDGYKKDDRVRPFATGLADGTKVPNEPEESYSSVSSESSVSSDSPSSSRSDSSSSQDSSNNPPPQSSEEQKKRILPPWVPQLPTGDPGFWTLVALGTGALIFFILSRRRKQEEDEE